MKKKILSLCMVVALAAVQIPAFVQAAELADGDVVWEENFENKAVGANVMEDTEHWAKSEIRGTNNGQYDYSATVAGNDGHKYLEISANLKDDGTSGGPTAGVVTKTVTEMGLAEGDVYTLSYDFKTELYNGYQTDYYHSISCDYADKNNIGSMSKHVYFSHSADSDNVSSINTYSTQDDKLTSIFGSGVRSLPSADLYISGWNSLQWVVYPATDNHAGYAELYLNGVYEGTLTNREGTAPEALVLAMYMQSGAESGTMYVDNIKVVKGAANGTAMAATTNTVVNAVTTGFEETDLANSVMPGVSQPSNTVKINNAKDYILFETAAGKSASDMAMHIYNTQVAEGETADSSSSENLEIFMNTNPSTKLYANGDSQEFSLDFAFDDVIQPFSITSGRMWSPDFKESNSSNYKAGNIVNVQQEKIKVGSIEFKLDEPLVSNTWYNLRLVLERGSSATPFKLYFTRADGTMQVFAGDFYNHYKKDYAGITKCLIEYTCNTNKKRGVMIDNFSIKNYIGGATPETVTASDAIELVDNGDGTVTASTIVDNATNPDAVLIVATYDGDTFSNAVIGTAGESASTLCEITASISKTDGQVVKAMLWDGIDTINPLLDVVSK